jgi:hypothetical protein
MDENFCMIIFSQLRLTLPVAPWFIDAAAGFIGLLVAVAAVWLQWKHFKKTHPVDQNIKSIRAPFGQTGAYNRWKNLYWREVRATFGLALISLFMVGVVVLLRGEVTIASNASVVFWIGMFFYNLWVAQWYAWRLSTKRKR